MLAVTGSTFSGNIGGGIFSGGTGSVTNSTFSGNSSLYGGGVLNSGVLNVSFSTFSGNSASNQGGGIYNEGTLTVKNTLLANTATGGNCGNSSGTLTSDGYNLSDDISCTTYFSGTGDLNNTSAGLSSAGLANNGGPTQTIALLPTSPAVDAIPLTPANYCTDVAGNPVTADQRGVTRPQGTGCDIGAYELVQSIPFSALSAKLAATIGGPLPGFALEANFTLGEASTGINPLTQPVTLTVGTYTVTIPVGSFKQLPNGGCYYLGEISKVGLVVTIAPLGENRFSLIAAAGPVTLTKSNPVTVTITIGENTGREALTASFITL